jgi:hypothetical protein
MVIPVAWTATYWPSADKHIIADATPPRTHTPSPRLFLDCFFILFDFLFALQSDF